MSVHEPNLTQQVYEHLRKQLCSGAMGARRQLVNRTIASELGTSTIPVREAIQRLVSEGLVEYVPGAGAFVRQPDRHELKQLYDLREVLEPLAGAEAAHNISMQELDEMEEICARWRELEKAIPKKGHASREQMNEWLDLDERYHDLLAAATRNRWLERILTGLRVVASVFSAQRGANELLTPDLAKHTVGEHVELVEALRKRDAELARKLLQEQIAHGKVVVLSFFERKPADSATPTTGKRRGNGR